LAWEEVGVGWGLTAIIIIVIGSETLRLNVITCLYDFVAVVVVLLLLLLLLLNLFHA